MCPRRNFVFSVGWKEAKWLFFFFCGFEGTNPEDTPVLYDKTSLRALSRLVDKRRKTFNGPLSDGLGRRGRVHETIMGRHFVKRRTHETYMQLAHLLRTIRHMWLLIDLEKDGRDTVLANQKISALFERVVLS